MPYTPQNWEDLPDETTPIDAAALTHMETGIDDATTTADAAAAAIAGLGSVYQPLDSDLTSIAALSTTSYGRGLLTTADAAAQTAGLDAFTSALKGLAPASGGGTTNFLRADGTWNAPGGGGTTWTRSTSTPSGGSDGDYHVQGAASFATSGGKIWRNYSGTWRAIGFMADWLADAAANGWTISPGFAVPPTFQAASGAYRQVTGSPTIATNSVDLAGAGAAARVNILCFPGGAAQVVGRFALDTLPSGGTALQFGCGNYYGLAYPYFDVNSGTKNVLFGGQSTGVTAETNDIFWASIGHSYGIGVIYRAGVIIWNAAVAGDLFTAGWGDQYGKSWFVGAAGALTTGKASLTEATVGIGGS